MTADKHTPFESRLESSLADIHKSVLEIKRAFGNVYERLADLQKSADAIYDAVTYDAAHGSGTAASFEDDFLDDSDG
jgi:hypothetical protein